uniref:Uncharacterized protein n=1 Tax=Oryza brachyantha TaxID=4533 RepID=J3L1T9_ORYBR
MCSASSILPSFTSTSTTELYVKSHGTNPASCILLSTSSARLASRSLQRATIATEYTRWSGSISEPGISSNSLTASQYIPSLKQARITTSNIHASRGCPFPRISASSARARAADALRAVTPRRSVRDLASGMTPRASMAAAPARPDRHREARRRLRSAVA